MLSVLSEKEKIFVFHVTLLVTSKRLDEFQDNKMLDQMSDLQQLTSVYQMVKRNLMKT